MSKTVIVSGGMIDEEVAKQVLNDDEDICIIAADKGVEFLYKNNIMPQYIVGDFDSIEKDIIDYYRNETEVPIREYNPVKDASDTEIAMRLGMTLGSRKMTILGATGGRIDHLWANIQSLVIACKAGVDACIIDAQNKIYVTDKSVTIKKADAYGQYLSVFAMSGEIYDFSISGTKWELDHHDLKPYDSLTVSNRFEKDEVKIEFPEGILVIMETRD